ncbi:ABC transporter substrate-binding protein [Flavobacterium sp. NRK1]|uniref:ABC transporter substrate-binding protein n=1 Tax=Flavobacterium sp. NRK1 TaxID=2954929 RepID=UPI002092822E|nr:ABC transporter substrate-binding protein [Flavobacterium sp. NRK1]MCO6148549.1 ABC transporter substrate-binding protein [Flavobacterium sp. NRK1]
MRNLYYLLLFVVLTISGCKNDTKTTSANSLAPVNTVKHAKGLQIYRYNGFTVVKVTNPWPDAKKAYTYVMQKKGGILPDSLKNYTTVQVPLKAVVVTSTTHIPSLETLGVENTLVGFPGTDFISSKKTRARIDSGKVKEAGANESLNTEVMIDLAPDAVVGFSISSNNKSLNSLEKSGLKILYNGDWTEQTPLGKAEWIKFFGALYDKEDKADKIFNNIENEYKKAFALAQKATDKPTVLSGAMFQDHWYLPQGGSWAALFLKDAKADYLWADSKGTGSLNLSFETVLDKAENADYWIGPSQFTTFKQMVDANPHYAQFKAFKTKNVYSYSSKKGATDGLIYYELAPNRPDLVLKDLIYIFHPELLPDYELHFFEKLK